MTIRNNEFIVNKVRGVAAERRVSQQDMATILNISRMSMSRRLTYKTPFPPEELVLLADALNVPVATFFGEMVAQTTQGRAA